MSGIFDAEKKYIKSGVSRFHTPGHSGKAEILPEFASVLPYDVTEVAEFDSLYHADGIIAACERRAADVFGAKASLISSGGCTLAIQTMLALAVDQIAHGHIAMGRNAHRTAVNAAALLDFEPEWIYPENGVVTAAEVEEKLKCGNIDAVYLTSPDYYGRMCDIAEISAVCHCYGVPLLVDNAHGSHLKFLSPDMHPITLGADMTACSVHKTLPVLTGGALLNISNERFISASKEKMELFGSTSPSYLTMASIDRCLDWLESDGQREFARLQHKIRCIKKYAVARGLFLPEGFCDPVRFTLDLHRSGIIGETAHDVFAGCGAECEFYDNQHIVFIATPFHDEEDFSRLYAGIDILCKMKPQPVEAAPQFEPPKRKMSVREAALASHETVSAEKAVGRISAAAECPCPPGIPVVIPGEIIDSGVAALLKYSGINSVKVVK